MTHQETESYNAGQQIENYLEKYERLMEVDRKNIEKKLTQESYNAGLDAGVNGCNLENCDDAFFATKELCAAWEEGYNEGKYPTPKPRSLRQIIRWSTDFNGEKYIAE